MKRIITLTCLIASIAIANAQNTFPSSGSAGIGTTSPNASSLLDMVSTSKGVLIPRMTKTQRDAITTPSTGLLIYQTNSTPGFYYYTGTAWTALKNAAGWGLKGNANTNPALNFIGTTDAQPLIFKVNNQPSGTLDFSSAANTSYGYKTLMSNTNFSNSAFGYHALFSNTSGGNNTALGSFNMINNITGYQNTSVGSNALMNNQNGNANCAFGYGALLNNTTGNANIAVGNLALFNNTDRSDNVAIGDSALSNNGIGVNEYWQAARNVALGNHALKSNTLGSDNTATGFNALYNNTDGTSNVANGSLALYSNTTGSQNTGIGYSSLYSNASGMNNVGIGCNALSSNITGTSNVAVGFQALYLDTSGCYNVAIGEKAMFSNQTGQYNVAIGKGALYSNIIQSGCVAVGSHALYNNALGVTDDSGEEGLYNTAVGANALLSNVVGCYNTAIGYKALESNTSGFNNTAIGLESLRYNTGYGNTATGTFSLSYNTTGVGNTAIGFSTLHMNGNGSNNIAIGYEALLYHENGSGNIGIGVHALKGNDGSNNIAIGNNSLWLNYNGNNNCGIGINSLNTNSIGSWNTCVGDNSDVSINNLNGASSFGTQAITNADNKIVIGASGIATMVIGGYKPWSNLSDGRFKEQVKENVPGLEFINQLRPVTYTVDVNKLQHHITAQMPDSIASRYYPDEDAIAVAKKTIQTGFIAQEVETAAKEIGYQFDGVNAPQNPTDNYSIAYSQFVPSLVKAVQELNTKMEGSNVSDSRLEKLEKENEDLKKQIQQMQECLNVLCQNNDRINHNFENTPQIKITPNPTNGIAQITISGNEKLQAISIRVIDNAGKLIRSFVSSSASATYDLDTRSLSKGSYSVQLFYQQQLLKSEILIVQ